MGELTSQTSLDLAVKLDAGLQPSLTEVQQEVPPNLKREFYDGVVFCHDNDLDAVETLRGEIEGWYSHLTPTDLEMLDEYFADKDQELLKDGYEELKRKDQLSFKVALLEPPAGTLKLEGIHDIVRRAGFVFPYYTRDFVMSPYHKTLCQMIDEYRTNEKGPEMNREYPQVIPFHLKHWRDSFTITGIPGGFVINDKDTFKKRLLEQLCKARIKRAKREEDQEKERERWIHDHKTEIQGAAAGRQAGEEAMGQELVSAPGPTGASIFVKAWGNKTAVSERGDGIKYPENVTGSEALVAGSSVEEVKGERVGHKFGLALVISNTEYNDPAENRIWSKDMPDKLRRELYDVRFDVRTFPDYKQSDLQTALEHVCRDPMLGDISCLVVFVMGHGGGGRLACPGGGRVKVEEFISVFSRSQYRLHEIPKVFIFQMCQTGSTEVPNIKEDGNTVVVFSTQLDTPDLDSEGKKDDQGQPIPGTGGSIYMNEFIQVLRDREDEDTFQKILGKTYSKVEELTRSYPEDTMIPVTFGSLGRSLKLQPKQRTT